MAGYKSISNRLLQDIEYCAIQNDVIYWYNDYFELKDTDGDGRDSIHVVDKRHDGYAVNQSMETVINKDFVKPTKYWNLETGLQTAVFRQDDKKRIVFLFRGSDEDADWEYDFDLSKKYVDGSGIFVHNGFYRYIHQAGWFNEFLGYCENTLKIQELGYDVLFTGHSLGGASCQLAAYFTAKKFPMVNFSTITFGSPRPGNQAFVNDFISLPNMVYPIRVVHDSDPVVQVPNYPYVNMGIIIHLVGKDDGSGASPKVDKVSGPYCICCCECCMFTDYHTMLTSAYWVKCVGEFPGPYHSPRCYRKGCTDLSKKINKEFLDAVTALEPSQFPFTNIMAAPTL